MSLQASLEERLLSALTDVQGNQMKGLVLATGSWPQDCLRLHFFPYSSSPTYGWWVFDGVCIVWDGVPWVRGCSEVWGPRAASCSP